MQLVAPPGYGSVSPFDKSKHAGMAVISKGRYAFASKLNAVYLNAVEFVQAARVYPVVFSANKEKDVYIPMAVTGLQNNENRFVDEYGNWDSDVYIPAYARRYPFCVVDVKPKSDSATQQLVCVDETALEESVNGFFDKNGEPVSAWTKFQSFMHEYESARLATQAFISKLVELELFEVFEAQAVHASGKQYRMTEMYRVSEKKLKALKAKPLRDLMAKNYLYFIYAHLMSLDNFQRLLDRERYS